MLLFYNYETQRMSTRLRRQSVKICQAAEWLKRPSRHVRYARARAAPQLVARIVSVTQAAEGGEGAMWCRGGLIRAEWMGRVECLCVLQAGRSRQKCQAVARRSLRHNGAAR